MGLRRERRAIRDGGRVLGLAGEGEREGERGFGCFRGLLRSDMSVRLSAGERERRTIDSRDGAR